MTISPSRRTGANTAERGPTQIRACALAQPPPLGVALGRGQARVQHRHGLAEAIGEARDDLRRERDLGDHHDRSAPLLERLGGGAQVDLGLAGGGDAVQQALLEAPLGDRGPQRLERGLLFGAELRARRELRADGRAGGGPGDGAPATSEPPRGARREHQPERPGQRRAVFLGHPPRQPDELLGDAQLERPQRRQQPLVGDLAALGQAGDDARGSCAPRTGRPASSRPSRPRAAARGAGSRTARAGRGRW